MTGAVAAAAAPAAGGANNGQQGEQGGNGFLAGLMRMALMYFAINYFVKGAGKSSAPAADAENADALADADAYNAATAASAAAAYPDYTGSPTSASKQRTADTASAAAAASAKTVPLQALVARNAFPAGADLDVALYLSTAAPAAAPGSYARHVVFTSEAGGRPLAAGTALPDLPLLEARHARERPLLSIDRDPAADAGSASASDAGAGGDCGGDCGGAGRQSSLLVWRARVPYAWPAPAEGEQPGLLSALLPAAVAAALQSGAALPGPGADREVPVTLPLSALPLSAPESDSAAAAAEEGSDEHVYSAGERAVGAALARNETVFAVLVVARTDRTSDRREPAAAVVHRWDAWREVKVSQRKSLLAGDNKQDKSGDLKDANDAGSVTVSGKDASATVNATRMARFVDTHLRFRMLLDHSVTTQAALPPEVRAAYQFYYPSPVEARAHAPAYMPPVYRDSFWALRDRAAEVNTSARALAVNLTVGLAPISMLAWRLQVAMEESWRLQDSLGVGANEDTTQEIKRMLVETNPLLLAVTVIVSLLHALFDYLAFKNDIAFWRENKSQEGLSMRSVLVSAGSQLVIFLYLVDNETSWMVLVSAGIGTVIEFWKVTKASDVRVDGVFPFVHVADKAEVAESETTRYDKEAFRYLGWAMLPLVLGCSVYSLVYDTHRSWYSWVLGSLVTSVYAFGFITMCPQLYLNYKLKSVAHLPWRMLTYKALNTFVDDFFAFVIKMPTLHRLACFRDDLIFFVYLYQRWAYRTDYSRANEFGVAFAAPEGSEGVTADAVKDESEIKTTVEGEIKDKKSEDAIDAKDSSSEDENDDDVQNDKSVDNNVRERK